MPLLAVVCSRCHSVLTYLHIPATMHPSVCSCSVQSLPQRAHIIAHSCHHAPICVLLQSMSKQMESNPRRFRASTVQITIDALMYRWTQCGHMRTTSQSTTHVGSCTVYRTSRASFKRSLGFLLRASAAEARQGQGRRRIAPVVARARDANLCSWQLVCLFYSTHGP